jgi:hypothetical protein
VDTKSSTSKIYIIVKVIYSIFMCFLFTNPTIVMRNSCNIFNIILLNSSHLDSPFFARIFRASTISNGIFAPSLSAARIPDVNPSSWNPYNVHAPTKDTLSELILGNRSCAATAYFRTSLERYLGGELRMCIFPFSKSSRFPWRKKRIQSNHNFTMHFPIQTLQVIQPICPMLKSLRWGYKQT